MSDYFIDRDTRPKTYPCHVCARDVVSGHKCICVPSQPMSVKIGARTKSK